MALGDEVYDIRTGRTLEVVWDGSLIDSWGTKGGLLKDCPQQRGDTDLVRFGAHPPNPHQGRKRANGNKRQFYHRKADR